MTTSSEITLGWMKLKHKEIRNLSNMAHCLTTDMLENIFGLELDQIREIYRQAGIVKPYINPLSMEALHFIMMWMYLSGRCSFSLNAHGKLEYVDRLPDKTAIEYDRMQAHDVISRIMNVIAVCKEDAWLVRYMAEELFNEGPDRRRAIIQDMFIHNRRTIIRSDYRQMDKYIDLDKMTYQRRVMFFSKMQFYCILDRIRLEACHVYKGNKEDVSYVIKGSETRAKNMKPIGIPLPSIDTSTPKGKAFIRCLRLEKGKDLPKLKEEADEDDDDE